MTRELLAYALIALVVLIAVSAALRARRDARRKYNSIWGKKRRKK